MEMVSEMERITITIEKSLYDDIEAARGDVPRSKFICRRLREAVPKQKKPKV